MARRHRSAPGMRTRHPSGRENPMRRSRIGLGLVLACLAFLLTACGGGDENGVTMPPTTPADPSPVDPTPVEPPPPPADPQLLTQICLDGSSPVDQTCPTPASTPTQEDIGNALYTATPVALDRAASAAPTFGSVSQGSNVRDGITTDSVSLSYIPHGDTFHPIATIRTGDGTVLRSNDDPTRMDVETSRPVRVIHVDPTSDWEADFAELLLHTGGLANSRGGILRVDPQVIWGGGGQGDVHWAIWKLSSMGTDVPYDGESSYPRVTTNNPQWTYAGG